MSKIVSTLSSSEGDYHVLEENHNSFDVCENPKFDSKSDIDELDDPPCGCFSFAPKWFQVFNNPKCLLLVLCWYGIFQGFAVNGLNNVNTSTLERRFQLPSSSVGWISSAYDVSAALFVLPFSFAGIRQHKPRWLFFAALSLVAGSFVYVLPHFTIGPYHLGEAKPETCVLGANVTCLSEDSQDEPRLHHFLYVFILAQALHGVGGTILYTIGSGYLDESVAVQDSPMYLAIFYAASGLGPAMGYVLGGVFLSFYVDFNILDTPQDLTPTDPRWVGAWWVGLLISASAMILGALFMLPFPRFIRGARAVRSQQQSQVCLGRGEAQASRHDFGSRLSDVPVALKILLTNPTFMFVSLAACTEGLVGSAFATYLPKLIQNLFSQPAGKASLLAGAIAIPGVAGGQLLGGIYAKKRKLLVPGMLRFSIVVVALSAVFTACIWIRCPDTPLAGVTVPYSQQADSSSLSPLATCNSACGCRSEVYTPVCGEDGLQYMSPCHAGCVSLQKGSYANCTCVAAYTESSVFYTANSSSQSLVVPAQQRWGGAKAGMCGTDCKLLWLFVPLFFVTVLCMFAASPALLSVTFRCIPNSQRTFGIGVQWVLARSLGTIPGPVLCGVIIDSACALWQNQPQAGCDATRGSCWVYHSRELSQNLFVLAFVLKLLSVLFLWLAFRFYRPPASVTAPLEENSEVKMQHLLDKDSADSAPC